MLQGQPTVSVLSISDAIYDAHGSYLLSLCADTIKAKMSIVYTTREISRFCDVNSPLHYLLADAALAYVKKYSITCRYILTTNADNAYSPLFFNLTTYNTDVILTNMIHKGKAFLTKPAVTHIDLGAYLASVNFLRRTGVSFLSSVPLRPTAKGWSLYIKYD